MSGFNRRNFLQTTGAFALAAAHGGAFPGIANAARTDELNIYCWEGYNSDDVLDPFRRETGAKVRAEGLTSDPDAVNRLRAGETKVWDLINLTQMWHLSDQLPAQCRKRVIRQSRASFSR